MKRARGTFVGRATPGTPIAVAAILAASCAASSTSGSQALREPPTTAASVATQAPPATATPGIQPNPAATATATSTRSGPGVATGKGYAVKAPEGYANDTAVAVAAPGAPPDLLLRRSPVDGFATNVNVLLDTVDPGRTLTLDDLASKIDKQMQQLKVTASPLSKVDLGGVPALARSYDVPPGLRSRQVFAIHADLVYMITFTSPAARYTSELSDFDAFLKSWQYTGT